MWKLYPFFCLPPLHCCWVDIQMSSATLRQSTWACWTSERPTRSFSHRWETVVSWTRRQQCAKRCEPHVRLCVWTGRGQNHACRHGGCDGQQCARRLAGPSVRPHDYGRGHVLHHGLGVLLLAGNNNLKKNPAGSSCSYFWRRYSVTVLKHPGPPSLFRRLQLTWSQSCRAAGCSPSPLGTWLCWLWRRGRG